MKEFLILLKGKGELDYSPEAFQKRMKEYQSWVEEIGTHYVRANRLENEGVHFLQKDKLQTDGPFVETKEIIAGYVIIKAADMEEAKEITNRCPLLNYFEIYLRPIVEE